MIPDELTGAVIARTCEIENALRARGATGSGLRELSGSKPDLLSPEAAKRLRWIGRIRNQVAHCGEPAEDSGFTPESFDAACGEILAELSALSGAVASGPPVDRPLPWPRVWIPLWQIGGLARAVRTAFGGAGGDCAALAGFAAGGALLPFPDWRLATAPLWLAVWIFGLLQLEKHRPFSGLLWIPGVNLGYFALNSIFLPRWKRLAALALPLGCDLAAPALFAVDWRAGCIALLAGWLTGIPVLLALGD